MNREDHVWLAGLVLAGLWIWTRDLGWTHQAGSSLPIVLALGWYIWLVGPWRFNPTTQPLRLIGLVLAAFLLILGIGTNITLLLALAWAIVLRVWLNSRLETTTNHKANRLILLPVMAFPWMALDGDMVSTFFRLTAAQTAQHLFAWVGFAVERSGTSLWIQGLPVTVNEACSGLGVLQAVMIAGVVLLEALIPQNNRFWMQVPLLILAAWAANVLRVLVIAVAALTWGPDFAAGPFHTWGGMTALIVVFCVAWGLIEIQSKKPLSS